MNVDRLTLPDEESALKSIRENASETALLSDFERQLNTTTDGREVIEVASQLLRRLTPATVYAFYRYSVQQDSLTCECTAGDDQRLLEGLTIPLGQRVTGWSGVNQRTSLNSNASLDLGQLSEMFDPPLQSSLSTPVLRGEQLVGVLTVYSPRNDAFSEAHRYYVEYASASLSRKLASPGKPLTKTVVTFPRSRIKR
jgi:GAF domain-containing protein